tara:strand:+ start:148 stop:276 length:129 start_codon:yes stop_codon:yes gene_type:complete
MINAEDYYDYVMDNLHEEGLELGLEGQELVDWIYAEVEKRGV